MATKWIENGASKVAFRCSDNKINIFLIGDSVRMGYCATVAKELSDIAEVFYPKDNCRSTQNVITSLQTWVNIGEDFRVLYLFSVYLPSG